MSHNTFGHLFRVTTFGESHGPAIGCVVDGAPPRIALTEADIQPYLDKRRPGQSRYEPHFSRGLVDGGWKPASEWFLRARLADGPEVGDMCPMGCTVTLEPTR